MPAPAKLSKLGDRRGLTESLELLAAINVARGEMESAARALGSAEILRESIGAPFPPGRRAAHERKVAAVRESMGEEALTAAWSAGRLTPPEQVKTA